MEREYLDHLFDLEKHIHEAVEREVDRSDSFFLGDLFEEDEEKKEPKRRGRPKGVKESAPRKRTKCKEILERLLRSLRNLDRLNEVIRKEGSQYVLYSKNKKKKLGTFKSKKAALKRERAIQYFKKK